MNTLLQNDVTILSKFIVLLLFRTDYHTMFLNIANDTVNANVTIVENIFV